MGLRMGFVTNILHIKNKASPGLVGLVGGSAISVEVCSNKTLVCCIQTTVCILRLVTSLGHLRCLGGSRDAVVKKAVEYCLIGIFECIMNGSCGFDAIFAAGS